MAANQIIFLVLRRMRVPLLLLICAYAVSVLGLVLVPGVEVDGRPQHLDFFHAFYVISYTATTIGFGELPYAFSDAQRLWITFSMYISVVAWVYAIGTIIALLQEPAFRRAIVSWRFAHSVRRITEPFYLVCGYGDTGSLLVQALTTRGFSAVVIDRSQERIDELSLENHPVHVPGLCADARQPGALLDAGLRHPRCRGVLALTDSDASNLKIAIAGRLLNAGATIISRAGSHDTQANMASFGTDLIINPFDTFADRLALALHSPDMFRLYEWLTMIPGRPLPRPLEPPRGTWILCGYGRFGKAVHRYLQYEGVQTVIIEKEPEATEAPPDAIKGRGTEAVTLREAHIEKAVGIVAGTDDDTNNLSILITAKELKSDLFTVARQNERENDALFAAAPIDLVMQRSRTIARKILTRISTPLLTEFLVQARHENAEWAQALAARLQPLLDDTVPERWTVEITPQGAGGLHAALHDGHEIHLSHLLADARRQTAQLPALALMLARGEDKTLLPREDTALATGDRILFCGRQGAADRMQWLLHNREILRRVLSAESAAHAV